MINTEIKVDFNFVKGIDSAVPLLNTINVNKYL